MWVMVQICFLAWRWGVLLFAGEMEWLRGCCGEAVIFLVAQNYVLLWCLQLQQFYHPPNTEKVLPISATAIQWYLHLPFLRNCLWWSGLSPGAQLSCVAGSLASRREAERRGISGSLSCAAPCSFSLLILWRMKVTRLLIKANKKALSVRWEEFGLVWFFQPGDMLITQHLNFLETEQYRHNLGSCGFLHKPEFYCHQVALL